MINLFVDTDCPFERVFFPDVLGNLCAIIGIDLIQSRTNAICGHLAVQDRYPKITISPCCNICRSYQSGKSTFIAYDDGASRSHRLDRHSGSRENDIVVLHTPRQVVNDLSYSGPERFRLNTSRFADPLNDFDVAPVLGQDEGLADRSIPLLSLKKSVKINCIVYQNRLAGDAWKFALDSIAAMSVDRNIFAYPRHIGCSIQPK